MTRAATPPPPCASANGHRACDPGGARRAGCGRSVARGPSSRHIHRERRTGASRGGAATGATTDGPSPRQAGVVRRRAPFFLTVSCKRSIARQRVLNAAAVGRASRNSASVASGWAVMSAANRCSWASANARRRNLVCFRGASDPVSRRRWISRWTHARLTSYLAATPRRPDPHPTPAPHVAVNPSSTEPWHLQRQKYHGGRTRYNQKTL